MLILSNRLEQITALDGSERTDRTIRTAKPIPRCFVMSEDGFPQYYGERGNAHGHRLHAIEGQLHDLVWKCMNCSAKPRTRKQHFREVDCES